jgi:hypothetical protein
MRLRHPKHLAGSIVLLGTTGVVLIGTTGVLANTAGLPLGTSTACGCKVALLRFKKEAPGGGACPAEFKVKGEKCILWVSSANGNEEIDEAAEVEPAPGVKEIAFAIPKENCNGFVLEPGVVGKEACKIEVQFEKPAEPPEKKGKLNIVRIHPKSLPPNEFEAVPFAGEW